MFVVQLPMENLNYELNNTSIYTYNDKSINQKKNPKYEISY